MDPERRNSIALLALAGVLLIIAALAWVDYVSQGIAYGAIVGLKGRERDLADMGSSALRALGLAALSEGLAIGLASWTLTCADRPVWARLCIGLASAAIADVSTYAVVRGL
jgi:hypothetical protein